MPPRSGKVVVTGAAGFVGSHLVERLLAEGSALTREADYQVVGVDCFTDYYARAIKEANLALAMGSPAFEFMEADMLDVDWAALLDGTEYVFHQAAQAGVRGSWGDSFGIYVRNNIQATQRLLEAAKQTPALKALIFASSSSVYGDAESFPTREDAVPLPISPYGVTKLTCEQLCRVYHQSFGVPAIILRYFVAYGPRQRPDMAFHRFIQAMLQGKEINIYGDGEQTRDFTYVSDTVQANMLAMNPKAVGQVFNIGGGSRITINQVIELLERIVGKPARVRYLPSQKGDARHTFADISRARRVLRYEPQVPIEEGLAKEVAWLAQCLQTPSPAARSVPSARGRT